MRTGGKEVEKELKSGGKDVENVLRTGGKDVENVLRTGGKEVEKEQRLSHLTKMSGTSLEFLSLISESVAT